MDESFTLASAASVIARRSARRQIARAMWQAAAAAVPPGPGRHPTAAPPAAHRRQLRVPADPGTDPGRGAAARGDWELEMAALSDTKRAEFERVMARAPAPRAGC